jgi:hypothetical protein
VIIGFMKKIEADPLKGMIMYSATNGEILGIDNNFVSLMNNRVTGKQIIQEEVRLNVLIPEINLELL